MLNAEWWKLPLQIAVGLVLAGLVQRVALFILQALGTRIN